MGSGPEYPVSAAAYYFGKSPFIVSLGKAADNFRVAKLMKLVHWIRPDEPAVPKNHKFHAGGPGIIKDVPCF